MSDAVELAAPMMPNIAALRACVDTLSDGATNDSNPLRHSAGLLHRCSLWAGSYVGPRPLHRSPCIRSPACHHGPSAALVGEGDWTWVRRRKRADSFPSVRASGKRARATDALTGEGIRMQMSLHRVVGRRAGRRCRPQSTTSPMSTIDRFWTAWAEDLPANGPLGWTAVPGACA